VASYTLIAATIANPTGIDTSGQAQRWSRLSSHVRCAPDTRAGEADGEDDPAVAVVEAANGAGRLEQHDHCVYDEQRERDQHGRDQATDTDAPYDQRRRDE
jgi:hypothetical protein